MPTEVERWKNQTRSRAYVIKYDRYHELTTEMVNSGGFITLTREEREINQERAADEKLDIFKNGILTPIKLIDPEDAKEFADNPNIQSEEDLEGMLKLSRKALEGRLADMTNIYPVLRLKELASKEDTKITVGNLAAIEARIKELKPPKVKMTSFADEKF